MRSETYFVEKKQLVSEVYENARTCRLIISVEKVTEGERRWAEAQKNEGGKRNQVGGGTAAAYV